MANWRPYLVVCLKIYFLRRLSHLNTFLSTSSDTFNWNESDATPTWITTLNELASIWYRVHVVQRPVSCGISLRSKQGWHHPHARHITATSLSHLLLFLLQKPNYVLTVVGNTPPTCLWVYAQLTQITGIRKTTAYGRNDGHRTPSEMTLLHRGRSNGNSTNYYKR